MYRYNCLNWLNKKIIATTDTFQVGSLTVRIRRYLVRYANVIVAPAPEETGRKRILYLKAEEFQTALHVGLKLRIWRKHFKRGAS